MGFVHKARFFSLRQILENTMSLSYCSSISRGWQALALSPPPFQVPYMSKSLSLSFSAVHLYSTLDNGEPLKNKKSVNLKVYKAFVPRCLMFTWPHYAMCNEGNSLSRQVLTLDSTTAILQELSSVTSIPITHTHKTTRLCSFSWSSPAESAGLEQKALAPPAPRWNTAWRTGHAYRSKRAPVEVSGILLHIMPV